MLKSFCDFSNWIGSSAKWIDTCTTSNQQTITIYTVKPVAKTIKVYWYGGSTISTASSGCT